MSLRRPVALVVLVAVGAMPIGCGETLRVDGPTTSPTTPTTTTATPAGSGSIGSPPVGAVPIDPALLDHLPTAIDGLAVMPAPESDALAAADPVVIVNGEAAATALAIDPVEGQFAHATLVRLGPGVMSDAFYRAWRDSFDAAACTPAGGVARRAETEIDGRPTFIASCVEDLRTYHVWLPESRTLVSVSSLGDRRLGEAMVAGIRD